MLNLVLLFIGTTELIVIGGVALLIFGGKKLPELMRGLGKGVKEFKQGMNAPEGNNTDQPEEAGRDLPENPQNADEPRQ